MTFFKDCKLVSEVKSLWRKLCFQYHPDTGHGDLETMKQVNTEYHKTLSSLNGEVSVGSDGKEHKYHYNQDTEQAAMDKIAELLKLKVEHNTAWTIELIGTWVWVSGTKREEKDLLNKTGAGLKWHSKRGMWYWRVFRGRRKMSSLSMDGIRHIYGAETFTTDDDRQVATV